MILVQRLHDFLVKSVGVEADRLSVYVDEGKIITDLHCPDPDYENHYTINVMINDWHTTSDRLRKLFAGVNQWLKEHQSFVVKQELKWESGIYTNDSALIVFRIPVAEPIDFIESDTDIEISIDDKNYQYQAHDFDAKAGVFLVLDHDADSVYRGEQQYSKSSEQPSQQAVLIVGTNSDDR